MDYITAIICTIVIYSCLKYFINLIWPKFSNGANILLDYIILINQRPTTEEDYEKTKLKDYDFKAIFKTNPKEILVVDRVVLAFNAFIPFSKGKRFVYGLDYNVFLSVAKFSSNAAVRIFLFILFLPLLIKVKGTKSIINHELL